MKHGLAITILAAGLALTSALATPAWAQMGGLNMNGSQPDMPMPNLESHSNTLPPEPEARADGYRLQGRCDVAIPIYRALVNQGAGYELAEFNLGQCLFTAAKTQSNPANTAALRGEAAAVMLKAADSGLPNAQKGLVSVYLDGTGVTADPIEAGKWSLLYHGNQARRMYGLPDVPADLQARLDTALNDAGWEKAQARADAWAPETTTSRADN